MHRYENPELVELFTTYTAGPASIGARFGRAAADASSADPLIVATGTDMVLYPGGGRRPLIEPFRLSTRGFKELAAVSHLGPALATLVALKDLGHTSWTADAERLLGSVRAARAANTVAVWRDRIAVETYRGRETAITAMVDYSCALSETYLVSALSEPGYLTPRTLREDFLAGGGPAAPPVPFNRVMIATFFLTGLDIARRLISWFDAQDLDWSRAMVVIAGRQGRPTAGVTWNTNSMAGVVLGAARGRLDLDRVYLAPHAPTPPPFDGADTGPAAALEPVLRGLWAGTRATAGLGALMFDGYPAFTPAPASAPELDATTTELHDMPRVGSPSDWLALISRLRVVLEDPRQLLSGAVTDYATALLIEHGNDPAAVTVPGLDNEPYPSAPRPTTQLLSPSHTGVT
jgi:hypothetical protein